MALTEKQKASRRKLKESRKAPANLGRLKKTIMYLDIGHLTYEQWVQYRKNYIGGSDVATILTNTEGKNLNPYQSKLELFHEKVGVVSKTGQETEATYSGHVLEDHIIDKYWVYHNMEDPDPLVTINNGVNKKKLRHARRIKDKMMYDPRFPHLKINLDSLIQNTRFEKSPRGILEVKSGLGRVWDTYEAGIPIVYIIQVQTYLLVTGLKYAEIAVLLDGRYFKCFPIWANEEIQARIREETAEFWDLVLEGRQIWDDPTLTHSEKIQALGVIEPPVDGGNAVDQYLKERFRSDYKAGQLLVDDNIAMLGNMYLMRNDIQKKAEEDKKEVAHKIKKIFLDNQVDEIVDPHGKVLISNRRTTEGRAPILRVNKTIKEFGN